MDDSLRRTAPPVKRESNNRGYWGRQVTRGWGKGPPDMCEEKVIATLSRRADKGASGVEEDVEFGERA